MTQPTWSDRANPLLSTDLDLVLSWQQQQFNGGVATASQPQPNTQHTVFHCRMSVRSTLCPLLPAPPSSSHQAASLHLTSGGAAIAPAPVSASSCDHSDQQDSLPPLPATVSPPFPPLSPYSPSSPLSQPLLSHTSSQSPTLLPAPLTSLNPEDGFLLPDSQHSTCISHPPSSLVLPPCESVSALTQPVPSDPPPPALALSLPSPSANPFLCHTEYPLYQPSLTPMPLPLTHTEPLTYADMQNTESSTYAFLEQNRGEEHADERERQQAESREERQTDRDYQIEEKNREEGQCQSRVAQRQQKQHKKKGSGPMVMCSGVRRTRESVQRRIAQRRASRVQMHHLMDRLCSLTDTDCTEQQAVKLERAITTLGTMQRQISDLEQAVAARKRALGLIEDSPCQPGTSSSSSSDSSSSTCPSTSSSSTCSFAPSSSTCSSADTCMATSSSISSSSSLTTHSAISASALSASTSGPSISSSSPPTSSSSSSSSSSSCPSTSSSASSCPPSYSAAVLSSFLSSYSSSPSPSSSLSVSSHPSSPHSSSVLSSQPLYPQVSSVSSPPAPSSIPTSHSSTIYSTSDTNTTNSTTTIHPVIAINHPNSYSKPMNNTLILHPDYTPISSYTTTIDNKSQNPYHPNPMSNPNPISNTNNIPNTSITTNNHNPNDNPNPMPCPRAQCFLQCPALFYVVSKDGIILDISYSVLNDLGFARHDLIGHSLLSRGVPRQFQGKVVDAFRRHHITRQSLWTQRLWFWSGIMVRSNGEWAESRGISSVFLSGQNNEPIGSLCFTMPVGQWHGEDELLDAHWSMYKVLGGLRRLWPL